MPQAPEPSGGPAPYTRPDEQEVLQALTALVGEYGRPVWALEVTRSLIDAHDQPGLDGRWVATVLSRLASQGKVIQVQRWRTGTSRWTLPTEQPPTPPTKNKRPQANDPSPPAR